MSALAFFPRDEARAAAFPPLADDVRPFAAALDRPRRSAPSPSSSSSSASLSASTAATDSAEDVDSDAESLSPSSYMPPADVASPAEACVGASSDATAAVAAAAAAGEVEKEVEEGVADEEAGVGA